VGKLDAYCVWGKGGESHVDEISQLKKLRLAHPCPSSIWLPALTLLTQPFCLILRGGTSRELGPGRKRSLKEETPPSEQEATGGGQEMVGINKIRRLAYQTAMVGAAAAALSLTAAAHSSNSSANPFSRDRSGEISVITDHMTSVGWRVPDRLTQDS